MPSSSLIKFFRSVQSTHFVVATLFSATEAIIFFIYDAKEQTSWIYFVNSYKVPFHKVLGNLHKAVYIGIKIQTYTDHYKGFIRVLQYTSVYLSVHIMYTGS